MRQLVSYHHLHPLAKALVLATADALAMVLVSVGLLKLAAFIQERQNGLPVGLNTPHVIMLTVMVAVAAFCFSFWCIREMQKRPELTTTWWAQLLAGIVGPAFVSAAAWLMSASNYSLSLGSYLTTASVFGTFIAPACYRLLAYKGAWHNKPVMTLGDMEDVEEVEILEEGDPIPAGAVLIEEASNGTLVMEAPWDENDRS